MSLRDRFDQRTGWNRDRSCAAYSTMMKRPIQVARNPLTPAPVTPIRGAPMWPKMNA